MSPTKNTIYNYNAFSYQMKKLRKQAPETPSDFQLDMIVLSTFDVDPADVSFVRIDLGRLEYNLVENFYSKLEKNQISTPTYKQYLDYKSQIKDDLGLDIKTKLDSQDYFWNYQKIA